MTALHIRDFPEELLTELKILAIRKKVTQRELVISTLQQIVDNSNKTEASKKKTQQ